MARRKAPKNPWARGFVGGECETGDRFGDVGDWDGDEQPMRHVADMVDKNLPIAHSGIDAHFKHDAYLRAGHNDTTMNIPWNQDGATPAEMMGGYPNVDIGGQSIVSPHDLPDPRFNGGSGVANDNPKLGTIR